MDENILAIGMAMLKKFGYTIWVYIQLATPISINYLSLGMHLNVGRGTFKTNN